MNRKELFYEAQSGVGPAASLSLPLQALWFDAQGRWEEAHRCIQDEGSVDAAWVHAYLHRKEGDLSNARYWYHRARKSVSEGSLQEEWREIVDSLLDV